MIYKVLSFDQPVYDDWWDGGYGRLVKEQILGCGVIEESISKRSFNLGVSGIFICKTPKEFVHILGDIMRVSLVNAKLEPWREGECL